MSRASVVVLMALLDGCSGSFSLLRQQPPVQVIEPAGQRPEIVQAGDTTEIIEPPAPERLCFVRARHFRGLVARPCASVAEETNP